MPVQHRRAADALRERKDVGLQILPLHQGCRGRAQQQCPDPGVSLQFVLGAREAKGWWLKGKLVCAVNGKGRASLLPSMVSFAGMGLILTFSFENIWQLLAGRCWVFPFNYPPVVSQKMVRQLKN